MIMAVGLSGGIIVVWKQTLDQVDFTHGDRQAIFGVIWQEQKPSWILGVVYASTCGLDHWKLWVETEAVLSLGLPVVLIGDSNCIVNSIDKKGGKSFHMNRDIKEFRDFLWRTRLMDLDFNGPNYTWCNNRISMAMVLERLDQAIATDLWLNFFWSLGLFVSQDLSWITILFYSLL